MNRPSIVAVGTIVWLGSEVMFFAGLFAIYFTLRSTSPGAVGRRDRAPQCDVRGDQHVHPRVRLVHLPVRCVRSRAAAAAAQELEDHRVGHGRVVLRHLLHGRHLRLLSGLRIRAPRRRGHLDLLERLRLGVLPDHRLPRPARDDAACSPSCSSSGARTPQRISATKRRPARSSCRTTGTSSTSCGSRSSSSSTF